MAPAEPDPRIGHVVDGRYRIIERLAQGGMGVVYRAERVPVGKPVAIKFLHSVYAEDASSVARFERETRVLSKLAHPNCVSVIDFGLDDAPYLVMDFAGGVTLRSLIDSGPLPLTDVASILRQVLAALAHAHAHGIIHRDIKPANIMISDEIGTGRHVRLLDFGLARLASSSSVTQSSVAIGTPSYMAPEQTLGGEVDARTDLYQVGVVLFEMLTGERLFVAEDTHALLEMHRTARVPRPSEVAPRLETKPGLDELVQRALAKAPAQRFQTAMEMAEALEEVMSGRWRRPRKPRRWALTLALLVLAAGAGYAALSVWRAQSAPTAPLAAHDAQASALASSADGAAALGDARAPDDATAATVPDAVPDAAPAGDAAAAPADASDATVAMIDAGADASSADAGLAATDAATSTGAPSESPEEEVAAADPSADEKTSDESDEPSEPKPPPRPAVPLAKTLPAVQALIKKGEREAAISSVHAMWRRTPKDARLPYLLGNLYFDKRWWTIGMQYYHAAIARSPAYKNNPTLIRNVISAIGLPKTRGKATFLLTKTIGAGAKGYVRTASRTHADPSVRKAAQDLLKRW